MTITEKVTEVVAEVLETEPSKIGPDTDLVGELDMDSVLAIDIATALEKYYKVQLPDESMEKLTSVRAIADLVEGLLAKSAS